MRVPLYHIVQYTSTPLAVFLIVSVRSSDQQENSKAIDHGTKPNRFKYAYEGVLGLEVEQSYCAAPRYV